MPRNESGGLAIIVIGVVLVVLLLPCLACSGLAAFRFLQVDMPASAPPPVVSIGPGADEQIVAQVCAITAALMGVGPSEVQPTTSLADLGADELDIVELVIELEEAFDVSIPDEAISEAAGSETWQNGSERLTMSKLAEIVEQQQASASGP